MDNLGQPMWFGRYRLTARIATGGMAEVYVGRHISESGEFGPMVAIKRLLPHLVKDSQVVRMFLNEARITSQIHHPNVVGIVDLGQQDGEPYIAMELLEGRTFAELRERAAESGQRVPTGIMLRVLCEACRGLDAAHRATDDAGQPLMLVHRDFTPDNIHVGAGGDVKVIDFGVAKTAAWGAGTEPGTLKGKFFYMSPEMILAKPVDHRADIFAAGVMLYEQLCGHRPFTGTSIEEVVLKIAAGKPKPPRGYDPAVPMLLEAVCLRALAHNPDARFQSLEELLEAIENVGGDAQVSSGGDVAEYLSLMFPLEKDPKRQTLRKAREADPSAPHARPVDFAGAQPPRDSGGSTMATDPSAPMPPDQTAEQPAEPPPRGTVTSKEPARAGGGWWKAVVAASLLLAGGAVAVKVLRSPALSADEVLKQARADVPGHAKQLGALGKNPAATEAQLAEAGKLLQEAKAWDAALELAEGWSARSGKDPRPALLEGRAATALRKGKRAESALQKADVLAPDDPEPNIALAELHTMQADAYGALDEYTRAVKKRSSPELLFKQGYLMSQIGRLEEASAVLEKVQSNPEAAAELGFVRYRQNNAAEAATLLKRALKQAPQLMVAHYYLGTVEYQQGDEKAARLSYLEADRLAGDDPRALRALCEMEEQTGAATLDETKKLISARFPKDAAALIAGCTAKKKK